MRVLNFLKRNKISLDGTKSVKNRINLEWWNKKENLGDYLALVIYNWMLDRKGCSHNKKVNKTIHLSTVGSIIGLATYDAVVWGSGIHVLGSISAIFHRKKIVKYDLRAVRGPITKAILNENGYCVEKCKCGDPAVLMPLIYPVSSVNKTYPYLVIHHYGSKKDNADKNELLISTHNYKYFIDEIVKSEKIISSSLHGIILAESYGVPAILLNEGIDNQLIKYYDWYYSTGRKSVKIANSIEEALSMEPMDLPDLTNMRNDLINSFPYDLWD